MPRGSATHPTEPTQASEASEATEDPKVTTRNSAPHVSSSSRSVEGGKKRARESAGNERGGPPRWVHFVAFDAPFQPVLVDTHLLRDVGCRSWLMVKHEPPHLNTEGVPTWRITSMSRAMLVAFLKCLFHHEFIVPNDVSYHEAMRALESEGVGVPGNKVEAPTAAAALKAAPLGIGMRKRAEGAPDGVQRICTLIANAIEEWPRLDVGMNAPLEGGDCGFTCNTSRCWVRFNERPKIDAHVWDPDPIYNLAKKKPYWLKATLTSIGFVHYRMVQERRFTSDQRNEKTFSILARDGVEKDSAFWFLSAKRDMQRYVRDDNREAIRHADKFTHTVLRAVDALGQLTPGVKQLSTASPEAKYYRACVSLAERTVRETPNLARLFNAECADDKGQTHERTALQKVLEARGIKVVMWKDSFDKFMRENGVKPLVFPPSFMSQLCTGGACALLDFYDHQKRTHDV